MKFTRRDATKLHSNLALLANSFYASCADYADITTGDAAFQTSAQALLDWAPIIDDFKRNDALIVRNSIHLRWIGVRRDLAKGLQTDNVLADFTALSDSPMR
jgi:hypothetical protein